MMQASQNGNDIPIIAIKLLNAVAQVAVCTPNQPVSAIKTTKAIEKFAPVIPNALVEHIVAFSPKSQPIIPPNTISTQQIANPINVAKNMLLTVNVLAKIPPTISIGIQIIVPIHINDTLIHVLLSLGNI